ncbi:glycosyl transferase family protein [Methanocaldococcus villosus KIN24-T80]|uniref:Glycosyl transferase family protein n=1 Tax=Methanocaldococcus villosus KIN24-T80 TaxID=1069083 RepID=N6UWC6_9EURY|nr:MJ1255/VC2487 family glycosyltransferase [Methanocaldococcus villosus]ENN96609.1 glycosyl transferase family protein [Methanocaldococcus villosus KIN24-T80]
MKILISVCGEGFGHTTRCLSIGKALEDSYDVAYLAYGKSYDFIKEHGYTVFKTYPEIKLKGEDGKFSIKSTVFNKEYSPRKAIERELKIIKEYKPDLIISDCKYSTIVVGKMLNKPIMCITNQNYTKYKFKTDIIVYPTMKFLNIIHKACEKIIIPDFPLPYTVCEYNLKLLNNMEFIGPLIRYNVDTVNDGNYILSVIGGFEYRYKILESLAEIAVKGGYNVKLVCGSYEVAKKLKNKYGDYKNIDIIPLAINMKGLIANASLIVSHGGHSTIMEAISFGKPLIVIPDLDHPEQNNNAKKVDDLKCGIYLSYYELNRLGEAIKEIEENEIYKKNAEKLMNLAKNYYNGKENIRRLIDNFFNNKFFRKKIFNVIKV